MNHEIYYTENQSTWYSLKGEGNNTGPAKSKPIVSLIVIALSIGSINTINLPITAQNIKKQNSTENNSFQIFSTTNEIEQENVNNNSEYATFSINNNTLEVEELAEKVTQAQLDEVKSHFDTKINSLKIEVVSELKEHIAMETDKVIEKMYEIEKEKKEKKASFAANYKAPVITGLIIFAAPFAVDLFQRIIDFFK